MFQAGSARSLHWRLTDRSACGVRDDWIDRGPKTQRITYLYTAQTIDQDTNLYYYRARYYDPRASVWECPDPILGVNLPKTAYSGP